MFKSVCSCKVQMLGLSSNKRSGLICLSSVLNQFGLHTRIILFPFKKKLLKPVPTNCPFNISMLGKFLSFDKAFLFKVRFFYSVLNFQVFAFNQILRKINKEKAKKLERKTKKDDSV
jgi:hypothetical protein